MRKVTTNELARDLEAALVGLARPLRELLTSHDARDTRRARQIIAAVLADKLGEFHTDRPAPAANQRQGHLPLQDDMVAARIPVVH